VTLKKTFVKREKSANTPREAPLTESTQSQHNFGFFGTNAEEKASCWVLTVHSEFEQFKKLLKSTWWRNGNQADVKRLEQTFQAYRGCAFRQIRRRTDVDDGYSMKDDVLSTLESRERLQELFSAEGLIQIIASSSKQQNKFCFT